MILDMTMTPEMGMRITPALLNLTHMLALPSMELHHLVQLELIENPALEELDSDTPDEQADTPSDLLAELEQLYAYDAVSGHATGSDTGLLYVAAPRSLAEQLLADLRACIAAVDYPVALLLVGSLDEHGFLQEEPENIAATLGVAPGRVEQVLQQLREVGPPGIATPDMRACLLAQIDTLAAAGQHCPYAREIVDSHLDDLGRHRYRPIACALGCTSSDVEAAQAFIKQYLCPHPAAAAPPGTRSDSQSAYMLPDVAIVAEQGKFVVEVLHSPRRVLRLNPLYHDLSRQTAHLDAESREHVQSYMARARTFLANLRQRETTLRQICEAIVEHQEEFLRHGVRHLAPLTRAEIAARLGIHESTVSRAIADKSAVLPGGTQLPLREFFVAARPVQDALRELVANETEPLSDAALARLLQAQGHRVARRTVTKYREQLQILPSTLR